MSFDCIAAVEKPSRTRAGGCLIRTKPSMAWEVLFPVAPDLPGHFVKILAVFKPAKVSGIDAEAYTRPKIFIAAAIFKIGVAAAVVDASAGRRS